MHKEHLSNKSSEMKQFSADNHNPNIYPSKKYDVIKNIMINQFYFLIDFHVLNVVW